MWCSLVRVGVGNGGLLCAPMNKNNRADVSSFKGVLRQVLDTDDLIQFSNHEDPRLERNTMWDNEAVMPVSSLQPIRYANEGVHARVKVARVARGEGQPVSLGEGGLEGIGQFPAVATTQASGSKRLSGLSRAEGSHQEIEW